MKNLSIQRIIAIVIIASIIILSTSALFAQTTLTYWGGGNNQWNRETPNDIFKIPTIKTINIAAYASYCNPSQGVYNWAVIDKDLESCVRYKKNAIVSVVLNSKCPEWFKNDMPDSVLYFVDVRGQGKIFESTIPIPYTDTYVAYCTSFIKALASHLRLNSAHYNLITGIGYGVIGNTTLEIKLPNDSVNPLSTNAIKVWTEYKYTSRKIIKVFNQTRNVYIEQFPTKNLIIDVISLDQMPIIGVDTVDVVSEMMRICGSASNPGRYIFKYTSLTPMYNGKMSDLIMSYGLRSILQTNPTVLSSLCTETPCSQVGIQQCFRLGKLNDAISIELQLDIINKYLSSVLNYKEQ